MAAIDQGEHRPLAAEAVIRRERRRDEAEPGEDGP